MAGAWRLSLCVVTASMLAASSANAFGSRLGPWRSPATVSYYYAVPYYYYCPPLPMVIPVPDARSGYAIPTPAPPSSTPEPPLQKAPAKAVTDPRLPVIVVSHALGGSHVAGAAPLPKDCCRVGFWNLSGRDVTLVINGKAWNLSKNRAVTLDLDRQFAWQIQGGTQHVERVPQGQSAHEVLIRE
jgi:hypothetical protein